MRIGRADVQTVDQCLDVLEAAFRSDLCTQLNEQDRTRLVSRLTHILETAQLKELKGT